MDHLKKYKTILLSVLCINILLVATHKGEFWPFSIFPMFSQAGNPWSRGLLVEIDSVEDSTLWQTKPRSQIADKIISLDSIGVDAIDYANFVSKTEAWNTKRINGMRDLLQIDQYSNARWMVTQVRGYLAGEDSVVVEGIPLLLVTPDTTYLNPDLNLN